MSRASVKAYQHLASLLEEAGQKTPPLSPGSNSAKTPPPIFPAGWAESWGEDEFGFWSGLTVHGVEQRFRWIPPGNAQIGSPASEAERYDDEIQYSRQVDGFWFAETVCTQDFWMAVTGEEPSDFSSGERPVGGVAWNDIKQKFLPLLRKRFDNLNPRLPREAEWEYACRAGEQTPFWWGDVLTTDLANYAGTMAYVNGPEGQDSNETVDVFNFFPNLWGLYQMHGNIWEWCEDVWKEDPTQQDSDEDAGQDRVIRGGSWNSPGRFLRSAMRNFNQAGSSDLNVGFRLVAGPGEHR